jgi:aldose 1-epimerase
LTLTSRAGPVVKITNYGATVTEVHLPDRDGRLADVVLGFDSVQGYVDHGSFFGAIVGRVANRIRDARFELGGTDYALAATDAPHHLHGGRRGWDRRVWQATAIDVPEGAGVELNYTSVDGEEGYPGTVQARVLYALTHSGELVIDMQAEADRDTLINLAHHGYWNLGGHDSGSVLDHELQLSASGFTPGDPVVPVGQITPVAGTPFDFRTPKPVGRDLQLAGGEPAGFDHNWVVDGEPGVLRRVAELRHPASGRVMTLDADQPGVQFYSGNFLDGSVTGKGQRYARHAGLCLETQAFPNAVNVPDWRSQVVLRAGERYRHRMLHRFFCSS